MVHLNITFPQDLKLKLDHEVKREKTKRSTLIQRAVRFYLGVKDQKKRNDFLKEGYIALNTVNKELMNDFKHVDSESLKHVN